MYPADPTYFDGFQYGWLRYVWAVFGIDIFGMSEGIGCRYITQLLTKYIFPIVFFGNFLYSLIKNWYIYETISSSKIMITIILIISALLWVSVSCNKLSIRKFLTKLTLVNKTVSFKSKEKMKKLISIALLVEIVWMLLQSCLLWYIFGSRQQKVFLSFLKFFALIWQYYGLTSAFVVTYCSTCCFLIHILRNCKETAEHLVAKPTTGKMFSFFSEYHEAVKSIEEFQHEFSACSFFCTVQLTFALSFDVLVVVEQKPTQALRVIQTIFFFLMSCASMLGVTVSAAQVPLEMDRIRDILMSANPKYVQKLLTDREFEVLVNMALQKRSIVMSGWNLLFFERSFLLKTFGVVFAQAVLFHQIILT
ncbi:hypothetical protein AVEN_51998-1 [Araneus ventricosus]|uniref:Gustatory receptor n=1 Tax=Araneus ventricosus TaxID=182803 RepID=A0A4Y2CFT6_ARAVE|nr:hypothetical protein AVEN_51998-1 [Araneus ventricosus]